jgi:hypothetical protein
MNTSQQAGKGKRPAENTTALAACSTECLSELKKLVGVLKELETVRANYTTVTKKHVQKDKGKMIHTLTMSRST